MKNTEQLFMPLVVFFLATHLFMVLSTNDSVAIEILIRGGAANILAAIISCVLIKLIRVPLLIKLSYALIAIITALSHANIAINGSFPDIHHMGLATNSTFIFSVLTDHSIQLRVIGYLVFIFSLSAIFNSVFRRNIIPLRPKLLIFAGSLLIYFSLSFCHSCDTFRWQASNILDYNLRGLLFNLEPSPNHYAADTNGRKLIPKEIGEQIITGEKNNVILVFIEGLSEHFVTPEYMPELYQLTQQGLTTQAFIAHQRQTNRGLYAAFCGAYPNLIIPGTKSDLMGLGNLPQYCLPRHLEENGFNTIFMQSAELGYMSKDQFAKKAGFSQWYGANEIKIANLRGSWGIDDMSLYNAAIELLKKQNEPPFFLGLLTSGTHPPFKTPSGEGDKMQAFKFASESIATFYQKLSEEGLLENTLFIITSDESVASSLPNLKDRIPDNKGFLLALGSEIETFKNPGLFGLVDIPISILNYLQLDNSYFGGRSVFQSFSKPRTLYAANTFKRSIYAIETNTILECSYNYKCNTYPAYGHSLNTIKESNGVNLSERKALQVNTLRQLVAKNDLSSELLKGNNINLSGKNYQGALSYLILGRYITDFAIGETLGFEVVINNSLQETTAIDLVLKLIVWDCSETDKNITNTGKIIPANKKYFKAYFAIPQIHKNQCLKMAVYSIDGKTPVPWRLEKLTGVRM